MPNVTSSHRCLILALNGLQFRSHPSLPPDVPTWDALSSFRPCNPPSSEMVEAEMNSTNDLQCYIFEQGDNGGTEILVIFPDCQTLATVLRLCQVELQFWLPNKFPLILFHPL